MKLTALLRAIAWMVISAERYKRKPPLICKQIDGRRPMERHGLFRYGALKRPVGHRPIDHMSGIAPQHFARFTMLSSCT